MTTPLIGAQLIIFGGTDYDPKNDPEPILAGLAAAGYQAVEAGAPQPQAFRRLLDRYGLVHAGLHTGPNGLDDVEPMLRTLEATGGRHVCNSGNRRWDARSLADYRETIGVLNRAGKQLAKHGVSLHYHNHDFEFEPLEETGQRPIDLLLEELDPAACDLCVDVAWVHRGGEDPAAFLRRHRERVGYLHLKDHAGETWTELGRGEVDLPAVLAVLPELSVEFAVVEQDRTEGEPMTSMRVSREHLRRIWNR
jgi:sugar phosphate isomerase/epimerase